MNLLLHLDPPSSLFRLAPIGVIFGLVIALTTIAHAQGLDQVDYSYTPLYQSNGNMNATTTQAAIPGSFLGGFDPKLLLPLLLIPAGLFLLRGSKSQPVDSRGVYRYQVSYHDIWRKTPSKSKSIRRFKR